MLFYSFTSFTSPATIYKYDIATGKSEVYKKPEVKFNPDLYETKQVFYPSKDGTKVPMFIIHKKGVKLDGTNPTMLYGYGGFNISLTPSEKSKVVKSRIAIIISRTEKGADRKSAVLKSVRAMQEWLLKGGCFQARAL